MKSYRAPPAPFFITMRGPDLTQGYRCSPAVVPASKPTAQRDVAIRGSARSMQPLAFGWEDLPNPERLAWGSRSKPLAEVPRIDHLPVALAEVSGTLQRPAGSRCWHQRLYRSRLDARLVAQYGNAVP